ncbi:hypothetical protein AAZX31_10G152600 [Glycine max]
MERRMTLRETFSLCLHPEFNIENQVGFLFGYL